MITLRLRDSCFPFAASASASDDTLEMRPRLLQWDRNAPPTVPTVYTDHHLEAALYEHAPIKIAWLIEPPSINPHSYAFVREHRSAFDHVLSHQRAFCHDTGGHWYAFGGTRIAPSDWGIPYKTQDVVIIASEKTQTEGHRLRHEAIRRFPRILPYGPQYMPIGGRPILALRSARFAVIIENEQSSDWFTEKLIDCFATGTIPIYRGCPHIGAYFDDDAIMQWQTLDELALWLNDTSPELYGALIGSVFTNLQAARAYTCAEDRLVTYLPDVFKEAV